MRRFQNSRLSRQAKALDTVESAERIAAVPEKKRLSRQAKALDTAESAEQIAAVPEKNIGK